MRKDTSSLSHGKDLTNRNVPRQIFFLGKSLSLCRYHNGFLSLFVLQAALQPGKLPVTTKSNLVTVTGPANRRFLTKEVLEFCGALTIYNTELLSSNTARNGTESKLTNRKGPSQPHLCFSLDARVCLFYSEIIKQTLRNTTYSKARSLRFRLSMNINNFNGIENCGGWLGYLKVCFFFFVLIN